MIQSKDDRTKPESNAFCRQKNQLTCSQLITLHCMLIVSPSHGNASHKCIFGHYAGVMFNTIMYSIWFPVLAGFSKYSHIMPTSSNHDNSYCTCNYIPHVHLSQGVCCQATGGEIHWVIVFREFQVFCCSQNLL